MGRGMKNKIKNIFKILAVTAGCLMFASFSPSLDGRAVVVDKGVFPQGLFAKTVGYLPGDIISVTNIAGDATVDILVIGALDPSEGVAIMLSPEAAEAIGIDSSANNIVKITKRSGQDDQVFGNAVISKSSAEIDDFDDEEFESIGAEQNSDAFDNTENEEPEEFEEEAAEEETFEEAAEDETEVPETEIAEETEEEPEVPEAVEEAEEEEAFEEEVIEEEETADEEFEEEETPVEDAEEENEEEAFEDETPDAIEEAAEEEAFEEDKLDELPAEEESEEESVEEEPEEFEEEAAEPEIEEETAEEETVEEDIPEEEESLEEEAFDEETPADIPEETTEAEDDVPAAESFEADELDDLPAETEAEPETEVSEETIEENETDEYEAIVLVPADANPPESEEDEVEDVISEDDIDAIDEEITLTPLVEETPAEPDEPKPEPEQEPKAVTSYDRYMVPSLKNLESGKYYIQIAVYSSEDNILDVINKYGTNYPITIVPMAGGSSKQILIGPVTMDEYKVVLERFKSYGFKDAFLRKIK